MSRAAKLVVVAMAAALGVAPGLAGCGGNKAKLRAPKAEAYACENPSCGYHFGIPRDIPLKERVWPPIVCPKCKQRTAVRAHVFTPKAGGPPVPVYYSKYTDAQIKIMEEYRNQTPVEQLRFMPPEELLAPQQETPLQRNEGSTEWFSPLKQPQKTMSAEEFNQKYVGLLEVYPGDWPVVSKEEVKQR